VASSLVGNYNEALANALMGSGSSAAAQAKAQREAEAAARAAESAAQAAAREAEREAERLQREAERQAELEARRAEMIAQAGVRRADAINEATALAEEAMTKGKEKIDQQIADARTQFERERQLQLDREALQDRHRDDLQRRQAELAGDRLGTSQLRELEDRDIRRAREDFDRAARRAGSPSRDREDLEALNAARFRNNSLEILALMRQQEQRRQATRDQQAEEDRAFVLRRQREDEDHARRLERQADDILMAKQHAGILEGIRKDQAAELAAFNQELAEEKLAERILAYERAKLELVRIQQEGVDRATAGAEQRHQADLDRAAQLGTTARDRVTQSITINN
jgi:hypothetical protein